MIDLNQIRAVFAQHMAEQPNARFSMDAALLAVCQMCYEAGAKDAGLCQADHAGKAAEPDSADGGWLPGNLKSTEPGVYERLYNAGRHNERVFFCRWDGKDWYPHAFSPSVAENAEYIGVSAEQNIPWRPVVNHATP